MCSQMIACVLIPGFPLRAALEARPSLALRPAALAPVEGTEPLIGPVTAAAEAAGVQPGMRLGEALATCPSLVLVEQDPVGVEQAWEEILRRLEDSAFAVEPVEPGCVFFETRGVERLYGGIQPALRRALAAGLDRVRARPERAGRELRKVALTARLVGGGSWRRTLTLREPSADQTKLRAALAPRLAELSAPATRLSIELVELAESTGRQ